MKIIIMITFSCIPDVWSGHEMWMKSGDASGRRMPQSLVDKEIIEKK